MDVRGIIVEKALAFIDLLGFSNMVKCDYVRARSVLNDFYNISYSEIKTNPEVCGTLFSDCLIANSENSAVLVNTICSIYRKCLQKNQLYPQRELGTFFLLPRGGISKGDVNIEERTEAPNIHKEFIVSPALVHSSKMEQTIKGSRLLIAVNHLNQEDMEFNWNRKVHAILYSDVGYTSYENYSYKDALWFRDLAKDCKDQKREIMDLLRIAMLMIKANENNHEILDQHIETFRIGLLSYSKHCETIINDEVLNRVLSEFRDDKYWLVWVSVLEMVLSSPDGQVASQNSNLVEFYKAVCLSSGWRNVIEYSNRQENVYFKHLLKTYIDKLNIKCGV